MEKISIIEICYLNVLIETTSEYEEYSPLRIGSTFLEENYGAILIHSIDNSMSVSLKNINGNIVKSLTVEN